MVNRRSITALSTVVALAFSVALAAQKKDDKKQSDAQKKEIQDVVRFVDGVASGQPAPNDLGLSWVHEDFLKAHCFVPPAARGVGEVGLRFRPLRTRRNFLDVLGTIWLDSATYLARRLELEYVDFDDSRGTVRVDFADVPVAGGTLRMPVGVAFAMRPSRKNATKRTEGKVTITYAGFEKVPPR